MINMMTMIDATCRHLSCSSPIRLPRRHILSPAAVAAFVLLAWLIGCVSGIRNDPFVAFAPLPSPRRANDAIGRISRPRTCSQSQPSTTSRCPVSRTQPIYATSTQLSLARYDNLVSGVAEISIGFALGVLWSEYAVITTGCGPLNFSDALERICYQGVILSAGASLFTRIVSGGTDLTTYICEDYYGGLLAESTVVQVRTAEWLSILAVIGAFVSLGFQIANGEQMDGLSGINVEMCRAVRDL